MVRRVAALNLGGKLRDLGRHRRRDHDSLQAPGWPERQQPQRQPQVDHSDQDQQLDWDGWPSGWCGDGWRRGIGGRCGVV